MTSNPPPPPSEEQVGPSQADIDAARAFWTQFSGEEEPKDSADTMCLARWLATLLAEREADAYRRGQERMRERVRAEWGSLLSPESLDIEDPQ